jgi:hypothetical protein
MSSTLAEDSKIQYPVSELSKVQLGVSMAYPTCDCTHLIMEVGLNRGGQQFDPVPLIISPQQNQHAHSAESIQASK